MKALTLCLMSSIRADMKYKSVLKERMIHFSSVSSTDLSNSSYVPTSFVLSLNNTAFQFEYKGLNYKYPSIKDAVLNLPFALIHYSEYQIKSKGIQSVTKFRSII
jgi:hypothetical protein